MKLSHTGYLRRNDTSWSPRRVLAIDVEGRTVQVPEGELDTFRLACASFAIRDGDRDARARREDFTAGEPDELWRWVNARCHTGHTTWLVAHGLHYDYSCGAAHRELEALGWRRVDWSTTAGARWVRWQRGRSRLVMVDLFNYLPLPLAKIGELVGLPKRTMPRQEATDRAWERYCERDVQIALEAFLRLLAWWDEADLGRWGFTSAACALAAFRHRFMLPNTIRRHDEPAARTLEREALFGGRREVYRKGRLPEGPWVDLDYVSHYLVTAMEQNVPVRLSDVGKVVGDPLERATRSDLGYIARVEVDVDEPLVPYRHPTLGVIYPVGRFVTTLAGPELELVRERGRIVRWLEAAVYHLEPAFDAWAEWLLPLVDGRLDPPAPVIRPLLKDWTRSLIGKFGQRAQPTRSPSCDGFANEADEITVNVGGGREQMPWTNRPLEDPCRGEDAYNAVPALTAWVHSAARVQLWRAMTLAGRNDVAYCDTDGFLVRAHRGNLERLHSLAPSIDPSARSVIAAIPEPLRSRAPASALERRRAKRDRIAEDPAPERVPGTMAVKARYGGVVVHRPQDYVLDRVEVIKGLPRERTKLGPRHYEAVYWPSMPWQLSHAEPGSYLRAIRDVQLADDYDRGWVLSDGRVVPLEVTWERRRLVVVPWSETSYRRHRLTLQDPAQGRRIAAHARSPGP